jgi:ribosomal peptide maturation radical SAM protein 1
MGHEFASRLPFIDTVIQGEGENIIIDVLRMVETGTELPRCISSLTATDLEKLPAPDYDSYFEFIQSTPVLESRASLDIGAISFETSRGCWWSEKSPCIFCGLNGPNRKYRMKTPARALEEVDLLSAKYKRYDFQACDNIIGKEYFDGFFKSLADKKTSYRFLFEVRSGLGLPKMQLLRDAGVASLQPGIESLHTDVLRLMNKGVSVTQNIDTLKWGRYLDIEMLWNMIYGFPGELPHYYSDIIDLIPRLVHLQPPSNFGSFRVDRFSPFFEKNSDSEEMKPSELYSICFPENWAYSQLAYSYVSKPLNDVPKNMVEDLRNAIFEWQQRWRNNNSRPRLEFKKGITTGHILDTRGSIKPTVTEIDGEYFRVARALDPKPLTAAQLAEETGIEFLRVQQICQDFIAESLIVAPDGKYVWLPVPEKI